MRPLLSNTIRKVLLHSLSQLAIESTSHGNMEAHEFESHTRNQYFVSGSILGGCGRKSSEASADPAERPTCLARDSAAKECTEIIPTVRTLFYDDEVLVDSQKHKGFV